MEEKQGRCEVRRKKGDEKRTKGNERDDWKRRKKSCRTSERSIEVMRV